MGNYNASPGVLLGLANTWTADQIIADGNGLVVGHSAQVAVGGTTPEFQVLGTSAADASPFFGRWTAGAFGPNFYILKSRNASIGSSTIVTSGDELGRFRWYGDDGEDFTVESARIAVITEGTIAENRVPSAMAFYTGTDAAPTVVTERMRIDSAGRVLIGDTASANNDRGLTINQGTNDDEIFTLKETGIAHGVTDDTETDTFFEIHKSDAASGGAYLRGFNGGSAKRALVIAGTVTTADSTRSTSGVAPILLTSELKSGNGAGAMGADKNLVAIRDSGTVRFIFDSDGSAHADVEWIAFDKYDDLALLDATQNVMTGRITPARFGDNSLYYDKEYLEDTGIVGKDSWHTEERDGQVQQRQMINFNKLAMLHHGAILQVGDRMIAIEKENAELRKMLEAGRN